MEFSEGTPRRKHYPDHEPDSAAPPPSHKPPSAGDLSIRRWDARSLKGTTFRGDRRSDLRANQLVFDTFTVRGLVHGSGLFSSDCRDQQKFAGYFIDNDANGSNSRVLMTLFNFRN